MSEMRRFGYIPMDPSYETTLLVTLRALLPGVSCAFALDMRPGAAFPGG
jgi:hypothetical protein